MAKYLKKVKGILDQFKKHTVTQIPRSENSEADALAWLAFTIDIEGLVTTLKNAFTSPASSTMRRCSAPRKSKLGWTRSYTTSPHIDSRGIRKRPGGLGTLQ